MRLFLIPISTRRVLVYSQRINQVTHSNPSWADKASAKASKLWFSWETGDKGWQKKITEHGNRLFDRIPFEEWSLKSIPPLSARRSPEEIKDKKTEVLYPPGVMTADKVPGILERLSTERNAIHRKRLMWSVIGMPIAAPFGLVPIIPNIPFFYLAYRAFSHWKALAGAKHLKYIVDRGLFLPVESKILDSLYNSPSEKPKFEEEEAVTDPEKMANSLGNSPREELLISPNNAQEVAKSLGVSELRVEIERASRQVALALKPKAS